MNRLQGLEDRLREAIERSGKTGAQIRRETGITKSSYYYHLSGGEMHPLVLARYCLALNVSADWLLGIKRERER